MKDDQLENHKEETIIPVELLRKKKLSETSNDKKYYPLRHLRSNYVCR